MSSEAPHYPLAPLSQPVAAEPGADDGSAAEAATDDGVAAAATPEATLDEKQRVLVDLIINVGTGLSNGLYVHGRPGTGKSRTIDATLNSLRRPWARFRGNLTPGGLFKFFETHHDRIIFIDDVVEIFGNKRALQHLLAALDSNPDGSRGRIISDCRENRPDRNICFTGGVIFASNLERHRSALFEALMDRVHCLNFNPSDEELMVQMRRIAAEGWCLNNEPGSPRLTPVECQTVIDFVIEECKTRSIRLTLRHLAIKAYPLFLQHKAGMGTVHWTDMVKTMLAQHVETLANTPPRSGVRRLTPAELEKIAAEIRARCPTPCERVTAWQERTGLTDRSYYRYAAMTSPVPA